MMSFSDFLSLFSICMNIVNLSVVSCEFLSPFSSSPGLSIECHTNWDAEEDSWREHNEGRGRRREHSKVESTQRGLFRKKTYDTQTTLLLQARDVSFVPSVFSSMSSSQYCALNALHQFSVSLLHLFVHVSLRRNIKGDRKRIDIFSMSLLPPQLLSPSISLFCQTLSGCVSPLLLLLDLNLESFRFYESATVLIQGSDLRTVQQDKFVLKDRRRLRLKTVAEPRLECSVKPDRDRRLLIWWLPMDKLLLNKTQSWCLSLAMLVCNCWICCCLLSGSVWRDQTFGPYLHDRDF